MAASGSGSGSGTQPPPAFVYVARASGSCLCNAVTWTTSMEPTETNLVSCNCNSCQKHCGSDSAVSLHLNKHDFLISGPVKCYSRQGGSGDPNMVHHYSCNTCGSTIGHEATIEKERIHISAGSVNDKTHAALQTRPCAEFIEGEKIPFATLQPNGALGAAFGAPQSFPVAAIPPKVYAVVNPNYVFPKFPFEP